MPTIRRLYRSGNSVVVSIPEHLLQACRLKVGDYLWLSLVKGPGGRPRVLFQPPPVSPHAAPDE